MADIIGTTSICPLERGQSGGNPLERGKSRGNPLEREKSGGNPFVCKILIQITSFVLGRWMRRYFDRRELYFSTDCPFEGLFLCFVQGYVDHDPFLSLTDRIRFSQRSDPDLVCTSIFQYLQTKVKKKILQQFSSN